MLYYIITFNYIIILYYIILYIFKLYIYSYLLIIINCFKQLIKVQFNHSNSILPFCVCIDVYLFVSTCYMLHKSMIWSGTILTYHLIPT